MRVLSSEDILSISISGGEDYENYPLRTYLKTRALQGTLIFGLLAAPGGVPFVILGSTLGLGLGLAYGYAEWLTFE